MAKTYICVIVATAFIVQLQALIVRQAHTTRADYCTSLINMESHFTIEVGIGTPRQKMELVADTGSSGVIAQSCSCTGKTAATCFTGTGQSSTFLPSVADWHNNLIHHEFGSGNITTTPVSEVVEVGHEVAKMTSLLLMVESQLHIPQFEGILGLGLPVAQQPEDVAWMKKRQSFMSAAGVKFFSICFTGTNAPGVLRFDPPPATKMLTQMGNYHWGLSFEGFSVGSGDVPASVCRREDMAPGMVTPCAAIPDSGTTDIMGPHDQIVKIEADICQRWPRCKAMVDKGMDGAEVDCKKVSLNGRATKEECERKWAEVNHDMFIQLMNTCSSWLGEGDGLAEVPSVFLHLVGHHREKETLELTSWAWITRSGNAYAGGSSCTPMFTDYTETTKENGPMWVIGTPLFHEYQVVFGMNPLAIGFDNKECTSCSDDNGGTSSSIMNFHASSSLTGHRVGRTIPRVLDKPKRRPTFEGDKAHIF